MPKPAADLAPGLKRAWRIAQNVIIDAERQHNDQAAAWLDVVAERIEDELQGGPPAPPRPSTMTRIDAAIFLQIHSGIDDGSITAFHDSRDEAYRKAARKLHPDAGGNHEDFVRLQEAMRILSQ